MGENSTIEWTDHTFNPWVGCTKISPACDHCYAESWAKRAGTPELWQGERRRTTASNWQQPRKWDRQAEREGMRRRVFCASLADVFDNQVPEEWRDDLWALIRETPHLDWLLLTKRPQNIAKMLPFDWVIGWDNVWLGTTVENRRERDIRMGFLRVVPARVRFLSCEPLLEDLEDTCLDGFHWVISGGESGPGARPAHPDWYRSLRDQCAAAGVSYLHKQNGEFVGLPEAFDHGITPKQIARATMVEINGLDMIRVGKHAAGRLLDERTHDEFPGRAAQAIEARRGETGTGSACESAVAESDAPKENDHG